MFLVHLTLYFIKQKYKSIYSSFGFLNFCRHIFCIANMLKIKINLRIKIICKMILIRKKRIMTALKKMIIVMKKLLSYCFPIT